MIITLCLYHHTSQLQQTLHQSPVASRNHITHLRTITALHLRHNNLTTTVATNSNTHYINRNNFHQSQQIATNITQIAANITSVATNSNTHYINRNNFHQSQQVAINITQIATNITCVATNSNKHYTSRNKHVATNITLVGTNSNKHYILHTCICSFITIASPSFRL